MEEISLPNIIEHPSIIFWGLQACVQLEILSCMNCYLRDWEGKDTQLCGMTRGKFVFHIAPLSLRWLFGIINKEYIIQVMSRLPDLVFDTQNMEHV